MDEASNPYAPGAGTKPPELAGRDSILKDARVTIQRVGAGRSFKSFIFIGLRGVGKTVLLNEVQRLAEESGCKTLHVEAHDGKTLPQLLVPPLKHVLLSLDAMAKATDATRRALRVLRSFVSSVKVKLGDIDIGVGLPPEKGAADSGDLEADLISLLLAVGEAAKSRDTTVVISIDEMQYLSEIELSALIMAVHRVAQKSLPVLVVGAGLPQLVGQMGQSKSYAERLFNFPKVGQLEPQDARAALAEPANKEGVRYEPAALDAILEVTEGYPYFLQEWGYQAWNIAACSPISLHDAKSATDRATANLDQSFFRVRFDRLTPREKDYLRAMAELGSGPHRSGDIAEKLGVMVESIAPLRSNLIKKGMIFSPQHGDTAFTVPLFDQYMKRVVPKMPKPRTRRK
ncbi:MAG: AAA family ATPase [Hyphomicrobiaceae bacterium]|nr:AAA family ATPase [Hyphomicrobiaceae bacterium]